MEIYECVICLSLNHNSRLHCKNCGTIPAVYSWTGKPINTEKGIEVIPAFGCSRASQRKAQRIYFRTVSFDYYAS